MLKEYYQLTKPGIIKGNLVVTAAGFLLASYGHIQIRLLVATLVGTALVIASGCVFNNYLDRGLDSKMKRTKQRALVTGAISAQDALLFGGMLGVVGLGMLMLSVNFLTMAIGLFGLFVYVVAYGYAKREAWWGTIVGSIAGATPPVAGYCAVTNHLDAAAVILFAVLVCWQMPHFYAIAIFRAKEYKAAGVPVLPLARGIQKTKLQIVFFIAAFTAATSLLTVFGYTGYTYQVVMGGLGLFWLWRSISGFHAVDDVAWARKMFGLSLVVLMAFSFMISVTAWLP